MDIACPFGKINESRRKSIEDGFTPRAWGDRPFLNATKPKGEEKVHELSRPP
jgi:hypothetical protein